MEIVIWMLLLILIPSGAIGSWQFCVGVVIVAVLLCIASNKIK